MVCSILDGRYQVSSTHRRKLSELWYLAISSFTALALALAWNRVQLGSKKILFPLIYAAVMIVSYIVLPPNPDKIGSSMDLIRTFRIVTALTSGIFWGILAIVFGSFRDRFIPRKEQSLQLSDRNQLMLLRIGSQ